MLVGCIRSATNTKGYVRLRANSRSQGTWPHQSLGGALAQPHVRYESCLAIAGIALKMKHSDNDASMLCACTDTAVVHVQKPSRYHMMRMDARCADIQRGQPGVSERFN